MAKGRQERGGTSRRRVVSGWEVESERKKTSNELVLGDGAEGKTQENPGLADNLENPPTNYENLKLQISNS